MMPASPSHDEISENVTDVAPGNVDQSYVVISGYHDFRSKRRANLHFIADELKMKGKTSFFSLRYSFLTRYRDDPRHDLWERANRMEHFNGVDCYLWRTVLHPFGMPRNLSKIENWFFAMYATRLPRAMHKAISEASHIFLESGIAITFSKFIKSINPSAKILYLASDSLSAINQAGYIRDFFHANRDDFDGARLPSPILKGDIPEGINCFFVPHGIQKEQFEEIGPSPFPAGSKNAVSVGSMLFDPEFFEIAGRLYPDINFHAIGCGRLGSPLDNVHYLPEMPFQNTLPFIKHSNFAIAPYDGRVESYLTHTSMKLMQYAYLGVPAVCPDAIASGSDGRFGYRQSDAASIGAAIDKALQCKVEPRSDILSWPEVVERLLNPEEYSDTQLAS